MELSAATEKIPATPGIDPGTFRLVAHCFKHKATPGRASSINILKHDNKTDRNMQPYANCFLNHKAHI
jgi:hypothetical protein